MYMTATDSNCSYTNVKMSQLRSRSQRSRPEPELKLFVVLIKLNKVSERARTVNITMETFPTWLLHNLSIFTKLPQRIGPRINVVMWYWYDWLLRNYLNNEDNKQNWTELFVERTVFYVLVSANDAL